VDAVAVDVKLQEEQAEGTVRAGWRGRVQRMLQQPAEWRLPAPAIIVAACLLGGCSLVPAAWRAGRRVQAGAAAPTLSPVMARFCSYALITLPIFVLFLSLN
jgi:hypothetical protein